MTDAAVGEVEPLALLAVARPIAEEVARHLLASLEGAGPAVSAKSTPTDLVTELDRWAERHIVDALRTARPDDSIRGEEGADVRGSSRVTWSVDPIDGTVNFVHAIPGFNVSIAALVDDEPVAGVVASPLHREIFCAAKGHGATCNDVPIRCAAPERAARAVVATGFGYDPDRRVRQAEVVARTIGRIADIRRFGAAALDLCWVGAGRVDAYWEVGLNRWDHAAGGLVAREAGAVVADLHGGPPSEASVLAAPPKIWGEMAELLLAAGADRV